MVFGKQMENSPLRKALYDSAKTKAIKKTLFKNQDMPDKKPIK